MIEGLTNSFIKIIFALFARSFAPFAVKKRANPSLKIFLTIIAVFYFLVNTEAQDDQLAESIRSILEALADNETDPEAGTGYAERLYDLSEKPVNINSADESELSRLFFLTDFQVKSIADYIHSYGKIYSVYEIMNIPGFNPELAETIVPFISLKGSKESGKDTLHIRNSLISNLCIKYPGSDSPELGSPVKLLARYKLSAGRLTAGVTSEKDSGEKLLAGRPPLPDFLSANITWTGKGILRRIVVGDFGIRYGLGTSVSTGLSPVISLTAPGLLSGGEEVRPYTSTNENDYFRGLAMSIRLGKAEISGFISRNRIDATTDSIAGNDAISIGSFYQAGLHNTLSTLGKKDVAVEYSSGLSVTCDIKTLRLGLVWSGNKLSIPVRKITNDPEKLFDFEGRSTRLFSAWYKAIAGRIILFGEITADSELKLGWVQGTSFRPADRLSVNLLYRSYDPGFTSFHGRGPFSSSSGDNLRGIFGNFTLEAARYLFLSAGCDIRWYPWLRYRCSAPSVTRSSEVRLLYQPDRAVSFELAYDYRLTAYDNPGSDGIASQTETVTRSVKGIFKYSPGENVILSARIIRKAAGRPVSHGILLLQDISLKLRGIPLRIWLRHSVFYTDDWNSRIYAYENDLPGSFNIPALSGRGSRTGIMVQWEPAGFIDFRIKYAFNQTADDRNSFKNSGELRAQVRLRF